MGNNRPILTKREIWYSPQLGVNLLSKRDDPRFGNQNFEVTHISLGDPDPKLFELPGKTVGSTRRRDFIAELIHWPHSAAQPSRFLINYRLLDRN